MAIAERRPPRRWSSPSGIIQPGDRRRLLRFLTGLAVVALSFAVRADAVAAAPAAPVTSVVVSTAEAPLSMTATDQAATARTAAGNQPASAPIPVELVAAAPVRVEPGTLIDGACPRKYAPRAPPAA